MGCLVTDLYHHSVPLTQPLKVGLPLLIVCLNNKSANDDLIMCKIEVNYDHTAQIMVRWLLG